LIVTTALDTNVVVAYWGPDPSLNRSVQAALESAFGYGNVVVAAPVFAELVAGPGRSEDFVNGFFEDTGIVIDWHLDEALWRSAGRAFRGYAERRRKHRDLGTRRILADFLIGAHAAAHGYRLLTMDERLYRAAFPTLKIEKI
jgi:predicted nucleic acid-binding protein